MYTSPYPAFSAATGAMSHTSKRSTSRGWAPRVAPSSAEAAASSSSGRTEVGTKAHVGRPSR